MPILEAMACGTPVLTSNRSALAEVAGDAAIKVNPNSIEELKRGLSCLHLNSELRKLYSERGIQRAQNYTWNCSAKQLEKVYEMICNNSKSIK